MSTKIHLETIKKNADSAEKTVSELKNELNTLTTQYNNLLAQQLREENKQLTIAIEEAKKDLVRHEVKNGIPQIPLPKHQLVEVSHDAVKVTEQPNTPKEAKQQKKEKKNKEVEEKPNQSTEPPLDVGRLDLRIGKVEDVQKHPDADSLYILKVNCGEKNARTVCSGLVKYVRVEELQDRMVVLLCNLKPVKMRGVTSEGMVMCASSPENVEVLSPPKGCVPGELVHCDGFERNPDAVMNPKKKIFETVAPDLSTNDALEACYKGTPLKIARKGSILATTLKRCPVK